MQFCEYLLFCLQIFELTAIKLAFYLKQIKDSFGSCRQMGTLLVHWSASRPSVLKVRDRSSGTTRVHSTTRSYWSAFGTARSVRSKPYQNSHEIRLTIQCLLTDVGLLFLSSCIILLQSLGNRALTQPRHLASENVISLSLFHSQQSSLVLYGC